MNVIFICIHNELEIIGVLFTFTKENLYTRVFKVCCE